jgi:hypothetical protein
VNFVFVIKLSSDFLQGSNTVSTNYEKIILKFFVIYIALARSKPGPDRKGNNLYNKIQNCIILESNLEFERAKGPTCSKYLHTSTGILSLIISQLQRSSVVNKNNLDK